MSAAASLLRAGEWSMGNGQCPECHACQPGRGWWTARVGHIPECARAEALRELGETPEMDRENTEPSRTQWLEFCKPFDDALRARLTDALRTALSELRPKE